MCGEFGTRERAWIDGGKLVIKQRVVLPEHQLLLGKTLISNGEVGVILLFDSGSPCLLFAMCHL